MKSAPVQNSSSVATLRLSFTSLFNNRVAPDNYRDYPDTELVEVEGSHTCTAVSLFIFSILLFSHTTVIAQDSTELVSVLAEMKETPIPKPLNKNRVYLITGLNVVGYGTSIVIFNNTWYKDYPKTSFHTFNDSKEWQQMDKSGHSWAAYNSARVSGAMWAWTGVGAKKATWIGGLSSSVYLTVIEILDAHSAKWGWSWADMGANVFGSGLFISQQLGWEEQRIQLKFSFHRKNYSDPMLNERSDNLFGNTWTERMLKDYNGQTYWLSANMKSFFPKSNLPVWLNVAFGYGADGMFGGFENKWTDGDPGFPIDRTDIKRYRQWYLAPDIDFTRIATDKKALRALFFFLNAFKFPTPGLELSNGHLKINAIHF